MNALTIFLKFLLKYLLLIILFGVLIFFTKSYGNYCSNLYAIFFLLPIIGILIVLYIIVLYVIDFKKKNFKITNYVVSILLVFFLIHLMVGYLNFKKGVFKTFIPETKRDKYSLKLFKDHTFLIRKQMNHGACESVGKYTIIEDTLKLDFENNNIEILTDSTFTFLYKLNKETKKVEPLKKGFKVLILEE